MPFATTAGEILPGGFGNLVVYTPNPTDYQDGLRWLNQIAAQWQLLPLTATSQRREEFLLVAGQGTPANPYTIGDGGDSDPQRPAAIDGVGLKVTSSTPNFELPRTIYTPDAYDSITQKELQSSYFTGLYYRATYDDGWGRIYLYPVPSEANTIVLYMDANVSEFADLTTSYDLPPGCALALTWTVSRRAAVPFGRPWTPEMETQRREANMIY